MWRKCSREYSEPAGQTQLAMIPSFFAITEGMSCLLAATGVKAFPSSFHGLLLQIILKGFEQQVPTMGCVVEADNNFLCSVSGFRGTARCLGQGNGFSPAGSRPTSGHLRECSLEDVAKEENYLPQHPPWSHCHITELWSV